MSDMSENLDKLVERIVELVHPLQIILFGSAARGDMTLDSDIDLLVVMPEGTHRRDTAMYLYSKIRGIPCAYDILVAHPDDLKKHANNIGLIYYQIIEEGKIIYAV